MVCTPLSHTLSQLRSANHLFVFVCFIVIFADTLQRVSVTIGVVGIAFIPAKSGTYIRALFESLV